MKMELKPLQQHFSICKVPNYTQVNMESEYVFLGKTDEEHSLVCETTDIPENVLEHDDGWMAFRIEGVLDFSLIGILAGISEILAKNQIGIFVVSTYNTDYVLTKEKHYNQALQGLADAGYDIKN